MLWLNFHLSNIELTFNAELSLSQIQLSITDIAAVAMGYFHRDFKSLVTFRNKLCFHVWWECKYTLDILDNDLIVSMNTTERISSEFTISQSFDECNCSNIHCTPSILSFNSLLMFGVYCLIHFLPKGNHAKVNQGWIAWIQTLLLNQRSNSYLIFDWQCWWYWW